MFDFTVQSAYIGGASPYSPAFETIATRTLQGVQSARVALVYPRTDLYSWEGAGDQEMVGRARAELSLSYIFASGINEQALGFIVAPNSSASALSNVNTERNCYLLANLAHVDNVGYVGTNSIVMALGNGLLTHYDLSAQVGQPTVANVTLQGLNLLFQASGSGQPLPAIQKLTAAATTGLYALPVAAQDIRTYFEAMPPSIQLAFSSGSAVGMAMSGSNSIPLESFRFSLDLPRTDMQAVGWAYPEARPVVWPATIQVAATARLNEFQLDAINRFGGTQDSGQFFTVAFKNDATPVDADAFAFKFVGAKLDTEGISTQVGGGSTSVDLSWTLKIFDVNRMGTAPNFYLLTTGNVFTSIIFPQVQYVSGSVPLTFNLSTGCYVSVISGPGFMTSNSVYVTDEAASTIVVRCVAQDGSDTRDLTVNVG